MSLKIYKPTSPGRRGMTGIKYNDYLTTTTPHKALTVGIHQRAGRNNAGRITAPHQGAGHKRVYRLVDFVYNKHNMQARVETVEYDPNRSAFISLVVFLDGERRYVLSWKGAKVGDVIIVSADANPTVSGNRLPLKMIPVGTIVHAVELQPAGGAKLARSAGSSLQVVAHNEGKTSLKMPSSEIRMVTDTCYASIGIVSNTEHNLVNLGKAGRSRWKGIRPTVRGSAMNPVDHPHGGGEQKQGIGLRRGPKTRQGKLAYGVKTRRPKKYSNVFIVTRRKTKRNQ
jgi:large subunit ribosomal protein L2